MFMKFRKHNSCFSYPGQLLSLRIVGQRQPVAGAESLKYLQHFRVLAQGDPADEPDQMRDDTPGPSRFGGDCRVHING